MNDEFIEQINQLYSKIPKKEKTFMEISGYPHYENVCSNILKFYFKPNEEHNMGELAIRALLDVVKEKNHSVNTAVNIENIKVQREFITQKGNRIDIVARNEEIIIGIENKIKANVYNDLYDYSKTLEKLGKNVAKIVLSLRKEELEESTGFINITYTELFEKLKPRLEQYENKQSKWYIYLIEFIKNIEGYEGEKSMETEITEWLNKHKEEVNKFYEIIEIARGNILKKIGQYTEIMEQRGKTIKTWQEENSAQATGYIPFDGYNIDANLSPEGWRIGAFVWRKSLLPSVKQKLMIGEYQIIEEETNHLWLEKLDYNCEPEEIANIVEKLVQAIEN